MDTINIECKKFVKSRILKFKHVQNFFNAYTNYKPTQNGAKKKMIVISCSLSIRKLIKIAQNCLNLSIYKV